MSDLDHTWQSAPLPNNLIPIPIFTADLHTDPYRANPEPVARLSDVLRLLDDLRSRLREKRDWAQEHAGNSGYTYDEHRDGQAYAYDDVLDLLEPAHEDPR